MTLISNAPGFKLFNLNQVIGEENVENNLVLLSLV